MVTVESENIRRIKALRAAYGWSQRELAAAFGCTNGAVGSWESGKNEISGMALTLIKVFEEKIKRSKGRATANEKLKGMIDLIPEVEHEKVMQILKVYVAK